MRSSTAVASVSALCSFKKKPTTRGSSLDLVEDALDRVRQAAAGGQVVLASGVGRKPQGGVFGDMDEVALVGTEH